MPALTLQQAFDLALQHHQSGRLPEAENLYRQILSHQPNHADALHMLGVVGHQAGHNEAAVELIRKAIALNPAAGHYYSNLGMALAAQGELDAAIAAFERAVALAPQLPEAHNNLGNALRMAARYADAIAAYRKAIALRPAYLDAHDNLGNVLQEVGQPADAIAEHRHALALNPQNAETHRNLGNALKDVGQLDEAIQCYRRAAAIRPDPHLAGNVLYALHMDPRCSRGQLYDEHARWNQAYARPLSASIRRHENDPDADRRLRVGYVSPDFREHVVGRFLLPLLGNHDHGRFEIFCYADVARQDETTQRLRGYADTWRNTMGMSDEQLAALVWQDRIDLLVDLSMHTLRNRLMAFARKPAPVQVTYLAYCGTTGLETMDWRLSDPYLDPPGDDEPVYSERTFRLPRTYWCYPAPGHAPPVAPLPADAAGHITFGCLNNYCKVSDPTISTWLQLLRQVSAASRLLVSSPPGGHRQRILDQAKGAGIDPDRVQFVGRLSLDQYFAQYNQIDIALDPFPYPGGTTTCDALWMGVPVVSLAGQAAASRAGLSLLSNLGLAELASRSVEQYIQIAADLARDLPRLREIRATLRPRMHSSPLMDAPQFARDVEAAFRQMWRNWCARPGQAIT